MEEFTLEAHASPEQHDSAEESTQLRKKELQNQEEKFTDEQLALAMKQHFTRYIDLLLIDERNRLRSAIASVKKDGLDDLHSRMAERLEFFKGTVRLGQLLGLISSAEAKTNNARFAEELIPLTERLAWHRQILTSPGSIDFRTRRKMRLKYAFSDLMS